MKTSHMIRTAVIAISLLLSGNAVAGGIAVDNDNTGKLTISSKFFLNATQRKTTDSIDPTQDTKSSGLAVDRAYLTVQYKADDVWSMKLTADAAHNSSKTSGKKTEVFIKNAFVKGAFAPAANFTIGVIGTPWIGYENKLDGHRYITKAYTDTKGFDSSADAGVGLSGKFADGMVGYAVAVVNGKGYGDIGESNAVDYNSRIGIYPVQGLTLDFQYRGGYKGTKKQPIIATEAKSTLMQAMATYSVDKDFRIGANYIQNKAKLTSTNVETKTSAIAAWGWAKLGNDFGAYGRYENSKVDVSNVTTNEKENRYVVGLEYFASKNITMSLAWDQSKVKNEIGTGSTIKDSRYGLFTQAKF